MGDIGSAKTLGGVGAIIMLVGGIIFFPLAIVGLILVAVAVKNISESANDRAIYSNFILFIVMQIIAIVALLAMFFLAFGGFAFYAATTGGGDVTDFGSFSTGLGATLAVCIVSFIVAYVLYILAAFYLKKSFDGIGNYTKVDMFKTTGLVYLIGAFLMIILIGAFVIFIAEILMIVAFFSLPDSLQQVGAPGMQPGPGQPAYPQQPQQPQQTGRVCPNCGRPIPMDAQVCPYCGKDFRQK
jgi:uncharacterized membrane protein